MRNRILIVVLGLSLGLAARYGVDRYRQFRDAPPTELTAPAPAATHSKSVEAPPGK